MLVFSLSVCGSLSCTVWYCQLERFVTWLVFGIEKRAFFSALSQNFFTTKGRVTYQDTRFLRLLG